jgi:hypothetical protein
MIVFKRGARARVPIHFAPPHKDRIANADNAYEKYVPACSNLMHNETIVNVNEPKRKGASGTLDIFSNKYSEREVLVYRKVKQTCLEYNPIPSPSS